MVNKSVMCSDFYADQATFHLHNFETSSGIGVCNLQSVILCLSEFTGVMSVYLNKPTPQIKMINIDQI